MSIIWSEKGFLKLPEMTIMSIITQTLGVTPIITQGLLWPYIIVSIGFPLDFAIYSQRFFYCSIITITTIIGEIVRNAVGVLRKLGRGQLRENEGTLSILLLLMDCTTLKSSSLIYIRLTIIARLH